MKVLRMAHIYLLEKATENERERVLIKCTDSGNRNMDIFYM